MIVLLLLLQAAGRTEVRDGDLDPAAFSESGAKPQDVLLTTSGKIEWKGVTFGTQRTPGPRHLRIGLLREVACGSVLARGGGRLSVLKPGAAYPGDPADDALWIPAERLEGTPAGREDFALWALPPGTKTRALRFTHVAAPSDPDPSGWLGGAAILAERLANVAPRAVVLSKSREEQARKIVDGSNNGTWKAWDNGEQGGAEVVTATNPEWILLVWPRPVKIRGLIALNAGFKSAEVDVFTGPAGVHPRESGAWKTVAGSTAIDPQYPRALGVNALDFAPVETRSIRLRILETSTNGHPHIKDAPKGGRRVWLGELMALADPADAPPADAESPPPPISIPLTLAEPGVVTLVIDDAAGRRVRNLVADTPFPAGGSLAGWDGSDDLLRDPQAARHGVYHIPTRLVEPGKYTVRGLVRRPLQLVYEMSLYSSGTPPWETADKTGCWMTNHTPPTAAAAVPASKLALGQPLLFLGAYVSEGGHGLQWVDEDGRKLGGQGWVGGNWTGAPTLAVDLGPKADPDHALYVGSVWEGELRLTAKSRELQDKPVAKLKLGDDPKKARAPELEGFDGGDKTFVLAGLAARDGVLYASMIRQNEILVVKDGAIAERRKLESPRGLAFDAEGRLLVLSGSRLLRGTETLADGLDDPRQIAVGPKGELYVSCRGKTHAVLRIGGKTIGKPGAPSAGLYDPERMNHPNGIAVDSRGRLWVAEDDFRPKRVSLWSPDGALVRAWYGPGEYGGGGVLDPQDPTRFYYKGLEFAIDWAAGTNRLRRVFHRPDELVKSHYGDHSPDTPLFPEGRGRWFTSAYTYNPTNGSSVVFVWRDREPVAALAGAFGSAQEWEILKTEPFRPRWPEGVNPAGERHRNPALFAWSDADGDGRPQPAEVTMAKAAGGGVTTSDDLSMVVSRVGDKTTRFAARWKSELPIWDLGAGETLAEGAQGPASSGGDQALVDVGSGWTIHTNAPKPFSNQGLGGSFKGAPRWSYPSLWPGLHASHESPAPDRPGMVVGHTRLLGAMFSPPGEGGPMFAVNGNQGNVYVFTADGLFVAELFHDIRNRPNWAMPRAERGMDVTQVSLHDENFWPSVTRTADGRVFLVDGARMSLVRIDGLETIRRLPDRTIEVTAEDLARAREAMAAAELARQAKRAADTAALPRRDVAPTLDGRLDDWPASTAWMPIDRRGVKAFFNSDSKPYDVSAAACVVGDSLYVAWRTGEKELLKNSGESANALFKTGGALDLMLGTDAGAPRDRRQPVAGDLRLLTTQVGRETRSLLYLPHAPGRGPAVPFSSPWRTITFDAVVDVSAQVTLAGVDGNFELSVPLKVLGWAPKPGEAYKADVGILRGNGFQTLQRVYWSNKATGITSDVPSEAELQPRLWGLWRLD